MVSVITPPIVSVVHILCPFFVNNEVYAYFSFFRLTLKYQKLSDYCHRQPSIAFLSSLFIHCIHSKLKWLSANATTRYVIFLFLYLWLWNFKKFSGNIFHLNFARPWTLTFQFLCTLRAVFLFSEFCTFKSYFQLWFFKIL